MFANPADIRRALRDPKKAARVMKSITLQTSSSAERVVNPEEGIRSAIQELVQSHDRSLEELFHDATGFEEEFIKPKTAVFSDLPYNPGGMSMGGKALYVITRLTKPETLLEIGVANGMSTAYILGALDDEGVSPESISIHAIDRPQFEYQIRERRGRFGVEKRGGLIPNDKEVGWLASNHLKQKYNYQLHIGDFTEILGDIVKIEDDFDLILYDASKDANEMEFAYETVVNNIGEEGVFISDDILVNDTFENTMEKQKGQFRIINNTGIYTER